MEWISPYITHQIFESDLRKEILQTGQQKVCILNKINWSFINLVLKKLKLPLKRFKQASKFLNQYPVTR